MFFRRSTCNCYVNWSDSCERDKEGVWRLTTTINLFMIKCLVQSLKSLEKYYTQKFRAGKKNQPRMILARIVSSEAEDITPKKARHHVEEDELCNAQQNDIPNPRCV